MHRSPSLPSLGLGLALVSAGIGSAQAYLVRDINPGSANSSPIELTGVANTLFFVASNGVSGSELWKSDGTPAGTVMVADLRPGSTGSFPTAFAVMGNSLF